MYKRGEYVRLKDISVAECEFMGISYGWWRAGELAKIRYVGDGYCEVQVGDDPIWSVSNKHLQTPCIFKQEI